VTCYFRHLNAVFEKAGINVTKDNKHEIDKIIHRIVGVEYKNCPATWKAVKTQLAENPDTLFQNSRRLGSRHKLLTAIILKLKILVTI
jgi:hypothetical protein